MFKKASELKITPKEHAALITVMGWLKDGSLREGPGGGFDMSDACGFSACGTVACIGGWVYLAMQGLKFDVGPLDRDARIEARMYVAEDKTEALHDLYYPWNIGFTKWETITASEAATAIANFLTSGDPSWDFVVAERTGEPA